MSETTNQLLDNLNALAAGLFLLTAFGIVAMRQVRGVLNLFIVQSLLLAASAALLGLRHQSEHLYGVALVNLITKPFIVPWLLRKTSPAEIYTRREIDQALNIPTSNRPNTKLWIRSARPNGRSAVVLEDLSVTTGPRERLKPYRQMN